MVPLLVNTSHFSVLSLVIMFSPPPRETLTMTPLPKEFGILANLLFLRVPGDGLFPAGHAGALGTKTVATVGDTRQVL